MRLMFVYWKVEDAGSAQTIYNYALAAQELGHEVVLYAPEDPHSRFHCSQDVESADALIFVLEWNIYLHNNLPLDLEGPIERSSREQRIIIDNDGMYNDVICIDGDYNHPEMIDSQRRTELYDSISDKIYQPSMHPRRDNVGTFLFHGYDPKWAIPLDFRDKQYGMFYVGSNWFRWRAMKRVLKAMEPIRHKVGRIGIVGHNWLGAPAGADQHLRDTAYLTDSAYLEQMNVEVGLPVTIDEVTQTMSKGIFTPVLVRPTFNHMRLVNPRLFETLAANTIPLFNLDGGYVEEIYGLQGLELLLGNDPTEKISDVLRRTEYYTSVVEDIRLHLKEKHSFTVRLKELLDIVTG